MTFRVRLAILRTIEGWIYSTMVGGFSPAQSEDKRLDTPIFLRFCFFCTSVAPQRPAHRAAPSHVATHLRTDGVLLYTGEKMDLNPGLLICQSFAVCYEEDRFEPGTTHLQSGALLLSHLSSLNTSRSDPSLKKNWRPPGTIASRLVHRLLGRRRCVGEVG
jgi:hypothetical protein